MIHPVKEVDDPETREDVMKKCRVDADLEISATEALTNAKLEVDRALDTANKTLHRLLEEIPLESEAVTKAAELNSIRDERVYAEVYENEADAKNISGNWVLKPHMARCVLRGFEQEVKELQLSQATDLRSEGYTVFTADVKPPSSTHTCRTVTWCAQNRHPSGSRKHWIRAEKQ